ncbi:sugar transferase [Paludisphaera soli]|uniref:sugar transferase n=1 Tax=Paludisphaera soli TaxID=2712865 RepID=UPI0013ED01F8|nr:sugar transferase [Paludisphaera soli]
MKLQIHPVGRPSYQHLKLASDVSLAGLLLLATAPLIILCLIAVRLTSRGPAIYTQRRVGLRGRPITIYKIRTMYQDCERETGAVWSTPGDPRVTLVGRFLRWSHFDELPQLVNILLGQMSLVGPRPERPEIISRIEKALPDYLRRLEVRPGLTGLAQVLQPPDTDLGSVRSKLELELRYLEQAGPWMDVRILLATPLHIIRCPKDWIARIFGFSGRGAPALEAAVTPDSAVGAEGPLVRPHYAG